MPTLSDVKELGNWFIGLVVAIAFGISHIRQNKKETDTGGSVEDAKQASTQRYIEMLEESRADAAELRGINKDVREQFAAALIEFREKLDRAQKGTGDLVEEVAQLRGEKVSLTAIVEDFRAQVIRIGITHRDEQNVHRNAVENQRHEITRLHIVIKDQAKQIRDLGGAPSLTNIMGPNE